MIPGYLNFFQVRRDDTHVEDGMIARGIIILSSIQPVPDVTLIPKFTGMLFYHGLSSSEKLARLDVAYPLFYFTVLINLLCRSVSQLIVHSELLFLEFK